MQSNKDTKLAVAKVATKLLREMDKISFAASGTHEYDNLRKTALDTIDACGYTIAGNPWKMNLKPVAPDVS